MDQVREACLSKTGFWILVGSIWVVGLLGIIISSIAINKAKKLRDQTNNEGKSMGFLVAMLILFIAIISGSTIYGIGLYASELKGGEAGGTPEGVKQYYSEMIPRPFRERGGGCPHHSDPHSHSHSHHHSH